MHDEERKVEFLELVYDLIFVYLIGRNNSLLHHFSGGFFTIYDYLTFSICTLAIIQIWNFSTFYINRYGRNKLRDHVFIFINMYLLYFMAQGTTANWQEYFSRYNFAWLLILLNIAAQYLIEMRNHQDAPWEIVQIKRTAIIILSEALIVAVSIPVFMLKNIVIAPAAILFGIIATMLSGKTNALVSIDFAHLSERAMLYVVFTFGEMIIAVASYFDGKMGLNTIYFSLFAFLIAAGLFMSYETVYDHILERNSTDGAGYMLIHVFLIFALNNITNALEFMHEPEVELLAKTFFLSGSMVLYFLCLFMTNRYAKSKLHFSLNYIIMHILIAIVFVMMMILFRGNMYINIAVTVLYVYGIFFMMYFYGRKKSLPSP